MLDKALEMSVSQARRRAHDGVPVPVRLRRAALVEPDGALARHGRADARVRADRRRAVPRRRRSVSRSGVAASDVAPGAAVWFPIYPFAPGLRVLNADLQMIIGLNR